MNLPSGYLKVVFISNYWCLGVNLRVPEKHFEIAVF